MQEPRIGDYVILSSRLEIGKVINVCTCDMCKERGYLEPILDNKNIFITDYDRNNSFHGYEIYEDVKQLIRPGDYVNGKLVTRKIAEDILAGEILDYPHIFSYDEEIINVETIVTKEQFEKIKYRIEV